MTMANHTRSEVLAYDLGGTKLEVGVVSSRGQILEHVRVRAPFDEGRDAVLALMVRLGREYLSSYPSISAAGIASAGPLDPEKGTLLDPTNFRSKVHGPWGTVPITRLLGRKLKLPVRLENDAAASLLAEHWVGAARRKKNVMILTLGTGLGTAFLCNGKLIRGGHGLHTEAGHLILNPHDRTAPCGCGNLGCAEAYLSGKNFSKRAAKSLGLKKLSGEELGALAKSGDPRTLRLFREYGEWLAVATHNYTVTFAPETVILTGSFAATSRYFLPETQRHLRKLLTRRRAPIDLLPRFVVSKLENSAGLLGGAYIAFHPHHI
jgi:glucokinase